MGFAACGRLHLTKYFLLILSLLVHVVASVIGLFARVRVGALARP
jgi:hypothetical protein